MIGGSVDFAKGLAVAWIALMCDLATAGEPPRGDRDYQRYCVWCHGPSGNGRGPSASRFDAPPRDFTAAAFKCRSTPSGNLPRDADLESSIRNGLHGGMPAWSTLGPLQLEDLIEYLKSFSPRWRTEGPGAPVAVPPEPPADRQSVARGEQLYSKLQCRQCHGDRGAGDGPSASALHDAQGNPIRAADLTRKNAFRCGDDTRRIVLTLITGLDGTPMPSFAASLTPEETWDLARYVVSLHR